MGARRSAETVSWEVDDPSVATVGSDGILTGLFDGTVVVTAVVQGVSATTVATVVSLIAEEAVVLDPAEFVLMTSPEDLEAMFVAGDPIVFQGDAANFPFSPGSIIVGSEGNGFLRRVTSISSVGDQITVETGPAALEEIVEDGAFIGAVQIPLSGGQGQVRAQPGVGAQLEWGPTEVVYAATGVSLQPDLVSVAGTVLFEAGGARIELNSGSIEFDPEVELEARFRLFSLESVRGVARGTITASVGVTASISASGSYNAEQTLVSTTTPFAALNGPVPVQGLVRLDLVAALTSSFSAEVSAESGYQASASVGIGAEYRSDGGWEGIFDTDTNAQGTLLNIDAEGSATIRVELRPRVRIILYSVAGPSITGVPYLQLAGEAQLDQCMVTATLTSGLDAVLGFDVSILGFSPTSYSHTFNGPTQTLLEYSAEIGFITFERVSGDGQMGTPGQALNDPLIVAVTDDEGSPVSGASVAFEVVSGGGSVSVATVVTGADGRAQVEWTLGEDPEQEARASFCGEAVTFAASVGTGNFSGRVIDGDTNAALAGATLTFNLRGGTSAPSVATTESDGEFQTGSLVLGQYDIVASADGFISTTLFNQSAMLDQNVRLETFQLVPDNPNPGSMSGVVRNAISAAGIAGAAVELRVGMNATTGDLAGMSVAGSDGAYSFTDLATGTYTVFASAEGFSDGLRTGIVVGDDTRPDQDVVLNPEGSSGESVRIVLTWGATPSDLDGHLTGPDGAGGRFHVWWSSKAGPAGTSQDVDDVSSFGPETITIPMPISGVYRYSVHDFTNLSSGTSTALSASGAKVQVFRGNQLVSTLFPPGGAGTLWTVFELDGDDLTPINQLSFNSSGGGTVGLRAADVESDAILIHRVVSQAKKNR